jgi:hypothetical protein
VDRGVVRWGIHRTTALPFPLVDLKSNRNGPSSANWFAVIHLLDFNV